MKSRLLYKTHRVLLLFIPLLLISCSKEMQQKADFEGYEKNQNSIAEVVIITDSESHTTVHIDDKDYSFSAERKQFTVKGGAKIEVFTELSQMAFCRIEVYVNGELMHYRTTDCEVLGSETRYTLPPILK